MKFRGVVKSLPKSGYAWQHTYFGKSMSELMSLIHLEDGNVVGAAIHPLTNGKKFEIQIYFEDKFLGTFVFDPK